MTWMTWLVLAGVGIVAMIALILVIAYGVITMCCLAIADVDDEATPPTNLLNSL